MLLLSKPATNGNCGIIKLDQDSSNAIELVLLRFKLIYHIQRLFDGQKDNMRPMAQHASFSHANCFDWLEI